MSNHTERGNATGFNVHTIDWSAMSIVPTALFLLCIIGHAIGFCVLWKVKVTLANQRIILLNLSATEMIFSISMLLRIVLPIYIGFHDLVILSWFEVTSGLMFKFLMLYLIFDRTLWTFIFI